MKKLLSGLQLTCNRCNKETFIPNGDLADCGWVEVKISIDAYGVDLCPECSKKFKETMRVFMMDESKNPGHF